jgi:hypothetical protein
MALAVSRRRQPLHYQATLSSPPRVRSCPSGLAPRSLTCFREPWLGRAKTCHKQTLPCCQALRFEHWRTRRRPGVIDDRGLQPIGANAVRTRSLSASATSLVLYASDGGSDCT